MMKILIALLVFIIPLAANADEYIVQFQKNAQTRHIIPFGLNEDIVCVGDTCFYMVDKETAEMLVDIGVSDTFYPTVLRHTMTLPNDTDFKDQWGLNDNDIDWLSGLDIMRDVELWEKSGPVAAIIDTGLAKHADIFGKNNEYDILWEISPEVYGHYVVDVLSPNDYVDLQGHGTNIAGIIGAATNNNFRIAGTNYGKGHLLPVKASRGAGNTFRDSDIIRALAYIVNMYENGVPILVVNMSLGGFAYSSAEYNSLAELKKRGIIVVAATGNGDSWGNGLNMGLGRNKIYPAEYNLENIISVAALDSDLNLASYSNYGGLTSIAAPGSNILTTGLSYLGKELTVGRENPVLNNWSFITSSQFRFDGVNGTYNVDNNGITLENIDLTDVRNKAYRSVAIRYTERQLGDGGSLVLAVKGGNDNSYRIASVASTAMGAGSSGYLNYEIPSAFTGISVKVYVSGVLQGAGSVVVEKIVVGGSDAPDSLQYKSGTSMAAPFVTGTLLAGKALYPHATSAQLVNMLYVASARADNLSDKVQDSRRLNIGAFLQLVEECKNLGGYCGVSQNFPARRVEELYAPPESSGKSSSKSVFSVVGCAMTTDGDRRWDLVWLLALPAYLIKRRFLH